MRAQAAIQTGQDGREVLARLIEQLPMVADGATVDLALLFASDAYQAEFPALLADLRQRTGARVVLGCSGQGTIGPRREIEDEAAMALQVFSLPGADITPLRFDAVELTLRDAEEVCREKLGPDLIHDANAVLLFADPFSVDPDRLITALSTIRSDMPVIGGLASARYAPRATYVFLDDTAYEDGATGLVLSGAYTVHTVVSQGAAPLGETWTITEADGNLIQSIGMRPALDVLSETFRDLQPEVQQRARSNLLIGLAMNEYRDEFRRGDFLIRNLVGVDQESGALAIGAHPRVGQTVQFQLRDPDAADEELRTLLLRAREELAGREVVGALLCSCNGRGQGLFGLPDHDAKVLDETLGDLPVAGFFCNGEIGPVDGKNFLHGFTASIALIVPVTGD